MIGIVYGYYVKHGGIGRYIAESLRRFKKPSNFELLTIEKSLDTPLGTKAVLVDCERDIRFMSIKENKSFSNSIKNLFRKYDTIHSHGIYDFLPDLYTAHICVDSYFSKFIDFFDKSHLPEHLRKAFSELIDLENEMIPNLENGRLITVSNKVADELSNKYKIDKENINIIPGASRFHKKERGAKIEKTDKNDVYTIGFVGGNLYAKGIIFMKDIFNELASRGVKLQCIGVGCGNDIKEFLNNDAKYKTDIRGKSDMGEDFYRNLDAFLSLSIYEAYSLTTLEAMSLGIPVISSNLNGVFYDFKREKFPLAEVKDISNTNNVVDTLERVLFDNCFRNNIIGSGYKIANCHTWDDVASKYERIYQKPL